MADINALDLKFTNSDEEEGRWEGDEFEVYEWELPERDIPPRRPFLPEIPFGTPETFDHGMDFPVMAAGKDKDSLVCRLCCMVYKLSAQDPKFLEYRETIPDKNLCMGCVRDREILSRWATAKNRRTLLMEELPSYCAWALCPEHPGTLLARTRSRWETKAFLDGRKDFRITSVRTFLDYFEDDWPKFWRLIGKTIERVNDMIAAENRPSCSVPVGCVKLKLTKGVLSKPTLTG